MAVTARLVVAGAALDADDDAVAAVTTALAAAGAPVTARVIVEDADVALEEALAAPSDLTIILAVPGTAAALATPAADVVRRALADVTGARLMPSEKIRAGLEQAALSRGRPLPRLTERATLVPQGATVWMTDGAEPGWLIESQGRAFVVLIPGARLSRMIEQHLVPYARSLTERSLTTGHPAVAVRTLRTAGVDLADIDARLGEWLKPRGAGGDVDVTTLPASGEVWVRLRAHAVTPSAAQDALALVEAKVVERLGDDYFGRDGETLERVVGRMLSQRSLMVSVAESCTGGLVGHRITSIPGSSAYFERGVQRHPGPHVDRREVAVQHDHEHVTRHGSEHRCGRQVTLASGSHQPSANSVRRTPSRSAGSSSESMCAMGRGFPATVNVASGSTASHGMSTNARRCASGWGSVSAASREVTSRSPSWHVTRSTSRVRGPHRSARTRSAAASSSCARCACRLAKSVGRPG